MHRLNQATKRPHRPSDFLELRSLGYDSIACADFDFAVEDFDAWYQARVNATDEIDAPKPPRTPKTHVPRYPTVRDVLDLDGTEAAENTELTDDEQAMVDALAAGSIDIADVLSGMTEH